MILVGTQATLAKIGIGPINAAVGAINDLQRATTGDRPAIRRRDGHKPVAATCTAGSWGSRRCRCPNLGAPTAMGLFVGGWALRLVGHMFEGRKPAFLDDLRGLLDGPLFLVAEAAFALGLSPELARRGRAGEPARWGRVDHAARRQLTRFGNLPRSGRRSSRPGTGVCARRCENYRVLRSLALVSSLLACTSCSFFAVHGPIDNGGSADTAGAPRRNTPVRPSTRSSWRSRSAARSAAKWSIRPRIRSIATSCITACPRSCSASSRDLGEHRHEPRRGVSDRQARPTARLRRLSGRHSVKRAAALLLVLPLACHFRLWHDPPYFPPEPQHVPLSVEWQWPVQVYSGGGRRRCRSPI